MFTAIKRLLGIQTIQDPNDIGTGTEDIHVLDLDAILRRLVDEGLVVSTDDYEDSTANFDMEQEEMENG